jgi:hypothetical protein
MKQELAFGIHIAIRSGSPECYTTGENLGNDRVTQADGWGTRIHFVAAHKNP